MDFISNDIKSQEMVKIRIDAVGGALDKIGAKYPVSFMDEMARQLTAGLEAATGVSGIAESSVELVMMFASGTYMEHISGNVTYRRLMLVDAVSAPRDFWVKWTRLEPTEGEYNESNILFELGEDVDQKIREKEYRYLLTAGKDKYHSSMGRKKVTEWREVIKRAVKRGELSRVESDFELAPETLELEERIADLLGKRIEARNQSKKEVPYVTPEDDEFARAMEKARQLVEGTEEPEAEEAPVVLESVAVEIDEEPEVIAEEEFTAEELEDEEIEVEIVELEEEIEASEESDEEENADLDIFADEESEDSEIEIEIEITEPEETEEEPAEELSPTEISAAEPVIEEPIAEEPIIDTVAEDIITEEPLEVTSVEEFSLFDAVEIEELPTEIELENTDSKIPEEELIVEELELEESMETTAYEPNSQQISIAERVADIRAELEIKIRLEYETRAREKAEAELVELRRELDRVRSESEAELAEARAEIEKLRADYERLLEDTETADLARAAEDARRRAEEAQLRAEIETQLRREAAERERLAEAARMAIEEQHRLQAENARIARQKEEEERLEAERVRRLEEERAIEAARQAELDRIYREEEEAKARAKAAMPDMSSKKYAYTSKTVKLLFRRSVDPNITTRIQQIIKATVDYYGKDNVYLKIRATVPDTQTVILEFTEIPLEEMELLGNIIKILGNSGLGIAKAIID